MSKIPCLVLITPLLLLLAGCYVTSGDVFDPRDSHRSYNQWPTSAFPTYRSVNRWDNRWHGRYYQDGSQSWYGGRGTHDCWSGHQHRNWGLGRF